VTRGAGSAVAAPAEQAPAVLRVSGGAGDALTSGALAALDGEPLARFLAGRRWFGEKARLEAGGTASAGGRAGARIAAVVPLDLAPPAALAVVEVDVGDGHIARYQLPLVVRPLADRGARAGAPPGAVLAAVEADDGRALLFDATEDAAFRRALGAAFARGATFGGGESGLTLLVEPVAGGGRPWPGGEADALESRVGSAEQSNTSIVYGDQAILKLFRRLEEGENPDVEIGRFLTTRTTFRNTPALLGTVTLLGRGGQRSVAGMLQRFVPGSADAWSYALERLAAYLHSGGAGHHFVDDAAELGRVTRALHEALASDPADAEFAPRRAAADDVRRWADGARRSMTAGLALLESRAAALPAAAAAEARGLLARRGEFAALVDAAADAVAGHAGALIRHHGDYHLGQVLRAPDGTFYVIDFEGEPARPLAERRERHGALRDVAGMLRSFGYAAAAGAMAAGGDRAASLAERWEGEVRGAFLAGYETGGEGERGGSSILPDDADARRQLLSLFEIEKAFYELAYELNNRPDWVWIPMHGIARLLQGALPTAG
jgi:trehalose synthase-fused probable maltokinase